MNDSPQKHNNIKINNKEKIHFKRKWKAAI